MVPFYFGDTEKQLFGVYFPSKMQLPQERGVLLCPPVAQEYIRTHMAIRQLAVLLAEAGFHVLKFDYYAVGDSAGNSEEGSVEQWKNDVRTAANELKDMSGARIISVVGLRLGAAIAVCALADDVEAKDIVLWDPVIQGKQYLDSLRRLQMELNLRNDVFDKHGNEEIVGFLFSKDMIRSIEAVNLLTVPVPNTEGVHFAVSEDLQYYRQFHEAIKAAGVDGCFQAVDDPANWDTIKEYDQTLLANHIIHSISKILLKTPE